MSQNGHVISVEIQGHRYPIHSSLDQEYVVRRCLKVVLKEEVEHHRYAVRDLAVLEGSAV